MDDLQFYVLFNNISVISGRCKDDNEKLCAMEPILPLRRFRLKRGSHPGPLDQRPAEQYRNRSYRYHGHYVSKFSIRFSIPLSAEASVI